MQPRNWVNWTTYDPTWARLSGPERTAIMALMEANTGKNWENDARNVAGAIVNRAGMTGQDIGKHVSQRVYQPTTERSQQARIPQIMASGAYPRVLSFVQDLQAGKVPNPAGDNTHFLAPEETMRRLQAREPGKYVSWSKPGSWTGYGRVEPGRYSNPDGSPVMRDSSHAFLAPEGRYSAPFRPTTYAAQDPDSVLGGYMGQQQPEYNGKQLASMDGPLIEGVFEPARGVPNPEGTGLNTSTIATGGNPVPLTESMKGAVPDFSVPEAAPSAPAPAVASSGPYGPAPLDAKAIADATKKKEAAPTEPQKQAEQPQRQAGANTADAYAKQQKDQSRKAILALSPWNKDLFEGII